MHSVIKQKFLTKLVLLSGDLLTDVRALKAYPAHMDHVVTESLFSSCHKAPNEPR